MLLHTIVYCVMRLTQQPDSGGETQSRYNFLKALRF